MLGSRKMLRVRNIFCGVKRHPLGFFARHFNSIRPLVSEAPTLNSVPHNIPNIHRSLWTFRRRYVSQHST